MKNCVTVFAILGDDEGGDDSGGGVFMTVVTAVDIASLMDWDCPCDGDEEEVRSVQDIFGAGHEEELHGESGMNRLIFSMQFFFLVCSCN